MKRFLCIAITVTFLVLGCSPQNDGVSIPMPSPDLPLSEDADILDRVIENRFTEFKANPPSPNTSEMTEYITYKARYAAKSFESDDIYTALEYIASSFLDDPWKDNETMENVMYYGMFLDYLYKRDSENQIFSEIGFDAYRCVKWVYRGVDAISDAQYAYEQTMDGLLETGVLVKTNK